MKYDEFSCGTQQTGSDASDANALTDQDPLQGKTDKTNGDDCNPMDMCKQMMESITTAANMAGLATPEVRALFEEWSTEVEKEVLIIIGKRQQADPLDIAQELKVSENTALYFVSKLIRDKKIKATGLVLV